MSTVPRGPSNPYDDHAGLESCDLLCAVEADATRRARNDCGLSFHGCAHSGEELLDLLDEILHGYDALRHSRGQCLISCPLIAHKLK